MTRNFRATHSMVFEDCVFHHERNVGAYLNRYAANRSRLEYFVWQRTCMSASSELRCLGKAKVHPRTRHEVPEG
jgi:hypothetical protein